MPIVADGAVIQKSKTECQTVNPDTARDEPSRLVIHCLQRYMLRSARLKGSSIFEKVYVLLSGVDPGEFRIGGGGRGAGRIYSYYRTYSTC